MMKVSKSKLILLILCLTFFSSISAYALSSMSGTVKVWAGLPLIGWTYVNTPYTAYYEEIFYEGVFPDGNIVAQQTNELLSSKKGTVVRAVKNVVLGPSYQSAGFSLFEFRFIENWYEITGVSTFDVYAAGECVTEVSGVRISLGRQTFLGEVDLGYYVIR